MHPYSVPGICERNSAARSHMAQKALGRDIGSAATAGAYRIAGLRRDRPYGTKLCWHGVKGLAVSDCSDLAGYMSRLSLPATIFWSVTAPGQYYAIRQVKFRALTCAARKNYVAAQGLADATVSSTPLALVRPQIWSRLCRFEDTPAATIQTAGPNREDFSQYAAFQAKPEEFSA